MKCQMLRASLWAINAHCKRRAIPKHEMKLIVDAITAKNWKQSKARRRNKQTALKNHPRLQVADLSFLRKA